MIKIKNKHDKLIIHINLLELRDDIENVLTSNTDLPASLIKSETDRLLDDTDKLEDILMPFIDSIYELVEKRANDGLFDFMEQDKAEEELFYQECGYE